jgi:hypothetical protein
MELTTYLGSGLEISRRSDEFINYHLHQQHTYIRQARKHTNKQPKLLACLPIYRPLLACLSNTLTAKALTRLVRSVGVLILRPGVNNSEYITLSSTLKGGKNRYIKWVVCSGISLREATSTYHKELLTYQNPRIKGIVPTSYSTTASWILKAYEDAKLQVVQSDSFL